MSGAGFALPDELAALEQAARRLAERSLAPAVREHEAAGRWPYQVLQVLSGLQLGGLDLPPDLGGVGAGALAKVVVLEALAIGDPGGLPAADQPGASAGALLACPDARLASEVASACLAGAAQALLVVADPEGPPPVEVAWAPAWPPVRWVWVSTGPNLRLLGEPAVSEAAGRCLGFGASGSLRVDLAGAPVAGEWELTPGGGSALRGRARLWSAAVATGVAQAAFDATVSYTTERVVFGKPVAHHQGNAFELAAAATYLHAARLALRHAAARLDAGDPFAGFWATQAWRDSIDVAVRMTDLGVQLLGGHGFLVDHLAEKRFREARMLGLLFGGSDSADADLTAQALEAPDPVTGEGWGK